MAPSTRSSCYRCSLPGLAEFTRFTSLGAISSLQRRERDSNPRCLATHAISNRAPSASRASLHMPLGPMSALQTTNEAILAEAVFSTRAFLGSLAEPARSRNSYRPGVASCTNMVQSDPAEREGFEPPVPQAVHLISSQAPSTNSAISPNTRSCGVRGTRARIPAACMWLPTACVWLPAVCVWLPAACIWFPGVCHLPTRRHTADPGAWSRVMKRRIFAWLVCVVDVWLESETVRHPTSRLSSRRAQVGAHNLLSYATSLTSFAHPCACCQPLH